MRAGKRKEVSASFWPDDLEWLDEECKRRTAGRSDILAELVAEARGRASDGDLIEMLVNRLEAVERHVRSIRATVSSEAQLPFVSDEHRPKTWADRKALIEKLAGALTNGS